MESNYLLFLVLDSNYLPFLALVSNYLPLYGWILNICHFSGLDCNYLSVFVVEI